MPVAETPSLGARIASARTQAILAADTIRQIQRWRRAYERHQLGADRYRAELATLGDRLGEYTLTLAALTDDILREAL